MAQIFFFLRGKKNKRPCQHCLPDVFYENAYQYLREASETASCLCVELWMGWVIFWAAMHSPWGAAEGRRPSEHN